MKRLAATLILAATVVCFGSGAPSLPAQTALENIAVLVGGYQVFGRFPQADEARPAAVTATLSTADGTVRAVASAATVVGGGFELGFTTGGVAPRRPVRIQPGNRVRIHVIDPVAGESSLSLDVVALRAAAEAATDTVSGIAPPGASLSLTAYGADGARASRSVTVDADGRWSVALGDRLDLGPGAYGTVLLIDAADTIYQAAWAIPALAVDIGASATQLRVRPGAVLRAVLEGAGGTVRGTGTGVAWTGLAELRLRDSGGETVPFLPGDRLAVTFEADEGEPSASDTPLELDLPPLTARVYPESDRVSGQAEPGARISVAVGSTGQPVLVVDADAQGVWRADFAGRVDITPDTRVTILPLSAPGVRIVAYAPMLVDVDPFVAAVAGRGTAGTPVWLAVDHATGRARGQALGRVAADGTFSLGVYAVERCPLFTLGAPSDCDPGEPIDLAEGDALKVTVDDLDQTVVFQPLAPKPDLSADSISGRAWPGSRVRVALGDGGPSRELVTGSDGRWQADFAELADLRSGTEIDLEAIAAEGYRTRFSFSAFRASAQTNGERVRIEGEPGLEVFVEVERAGKIVGSGECRVHRTACEALLGDAGVHANDDPVRLAADDLVLVYPQDASTASIALFPMTAHIDVAGSDVVGLAPPNAEVRIVFANDQGQAAPIDTLAATDDTGVYDHEFGVSEQSLLVPGLIADVFHVLSDGHQYQARAVVEVARVTAGRSSITGLAEPGAHVTATLRRTSEGDGPNGPRAATGETTAAGDGGFTVMLKDAADQYVVPAAGDTVSWTFQRGPRTVERTIEIGELAAWPLGSGGSVAGVAAPGAAVQAIHHLWAQPGSPELVTVGGMAEPSGRFVLPDPPVDRSGVRAVEIVQATAEGDELRHVVDLGLPPGRVWLPVAVASALVR